MAMTNNKRLSPGNWYALRYAVLRRDKFQCQYCGQNAPNTKLEVDHIVPLAEGGTNELDNLKTSCYACNRGKNSLWIIERMGRSPHGFKRGPLSQLPVEDTTAFLLLRELNQHPRQNCRELARGINRMEGTVRTVLARMLERQLVKREPSPKGILWFP